MKNRKDIEYFLRLPYTTQLHPSAEGGYVVSVVELPGCISQGDDVQDALKMIEDAKICWLEAALDDGHEIPEPDSGDAYSGRFPLRMPLTLHGILAKEARKEKVSLNQYINYQLAKSVGYKKS